MKRPKLRKYNVVYLLVIIYFGCTHTTSDEVTDSELKRTDVTVDTKPRIEGDLSIFEYDLSMYNEKFLLLITPTIDLATDKYSSTILLTQKGDTIFNKQITLDSLAQTIMKYKVFADSSEYSKIATDYELRKVVYHGVRTNDLYFVADITSKTRNQDLKVLFQISYAYKGEIGKLFVNGFSKKGFGPRQRKGKVVNKNALGNF